jgi:hypothetical protein
MLFLELFNIDAHKDNLQDKANFTSLSFAVEKICLENMPFFSTYAAKNLSILRFIVCPKPSFQTYYQLI